jgi:hypothetical protein
MLAEALNDAINSSLPKLTERFTKEYPGFDCRKLQPWYEANSELWKGFCGYALDLAGFSPASSPTAHNSLGDREPAWRHWRPVSVGALAEIVVVLFWMVLLISHGFFKVEPDLEQWELLPKVSRRRGFRLLWDVFHWAAKLHSKNNSAPARRAAYEIAAVLVPNIARGYETDRNSLLRWKQRRRNRAPG